MNLPSSLATIALTILATTTATAAMPSNLHPREYCSIATDVGLPAKRAFSASTLGCSSAYRELSAASPGLSNNVAFYVSANGDPLALKRLSLQLNVNNPRAATSAHAELTQATASLARTLLGKEFPELLRAVKQGKAYRMQDTQWRVEVEREAWPTGRGYEINVRFYPAS
jgi:hypothetical protein